MAENHAHSSTTSQDHLSIGIVIVNYNVKYFLRQCIESIYRSSFSKEYKVVVVDNNSADDSLDMLRSQFPEVSVIANKENVGFGRANNQAFDIIEADYILILNPDTLVQEDTLQICYDYLESNPEYGAVGVKLLDGAGNYLPESKRGFPTPLNALFKLTSLSKIFSKSSFFNSYYLGHKDSEQTQQMEVLSGAFTFIRKGLLDSIGGFDEDYFMYGEDIEMSYQIKEQGMHIAYLPTTSIVHFKGESTSKSSIQYIKNFYGAMGIYASKRNKGKSGVWGLILRCGILLSALAGILKSIGRYFLRPLIDSAILIGGATLISRIWATIYFDNPHYYEASDTILSISVAAVILILTYAFFGQYDKRHNLKHLMYGFIFGAFAVLSVYGLFPLEWRFSRFVLLSLVLLSPLIFYITRLAYNLFSEGSFSFDTFSAKRIAIVGENDSCRQIQQILNSHLDSHQVIGFVNNEGLGSLDEITQVVASRKISELIFCSKDVEGSKIMNVMSSLGNKVTYKIAADDNKSLLGSDSKDETGAWYTMDIGFKIDQVFHRRAKRFVDLLLSIMVLFFFPIVLLFSKRRSLIWSNFISVLIGKKTWIGYNSSERLLPIIREGVFSPLVSDTYYARNYSVWLEVETIIKRFFGQ